jgi:hypothetical protein
MRYNFHDQLASIKRDPKYRLPDDINAPVVSFLKRIGCDIGIEILKRYQDHINYGTIDLINKHTPNAKLSIQVDAGMAEGYTQHEMVEIGDWSAIFYKTIRNDNLTKKKQLTKDVAK